MDTYENENLGFDPLEVTQEPEPLEVTAAETDFAQNTTQEPVTAEPVQPKKESPFADSPYAKAEPAQQPMGSGYAFPGNTPKAPKQKKTGKKSGLRVAAFLVSAALVVVASCSLGVNLSENRWQKEIQSLTERYDSKITALEEQIAAMGDTGNSVSGSPVMSDGLTPGQVYAQNKNAVVAISCTTQLSGFGQGGTTGSSGSGFILTADGYVITNYHVIQDADVVNVITYDGTEYRAMVKGFDANNDLAVLKIQAEGLQTVTVGKSSDLIIGDMVVAIGNPLGELTSTQTVGYISGKDRDVSTDGTVINMLQTDAAINPGNSGGPLFNMKGEVIGITTAKYSGTTSSGASIEGIGFAIPMDDVTKMIDDIMAHGYVTGAYLGVSVRDVDEYVSSVYGLPMGARVEEVVVGSCSEKAGIQVGDIIIEMGGYTVENYTDLSRALRNFEAGDTTTITVFRSGREITLTITLDAKPNTNQAVPDENGEIPMPSEGNYDDWYEYFFRRFGEGFNEQP